MISFFKTLHIVCRSSASAWSISPDHDHDFNDYVGDDDYAHDDDYDDDGDDGDDDEDVNVDF